ncbi:MAG: endonuclease III [Phycisphaeraceae bacterium]
MAAKKTTAAAGDAKKRAGSIYRKLVKLYPAAHTALEHRDAYQLLVATILSAQCTDERVNKTTPALFGKYPDAATLAESEQEDVEKIVHSCGFYRAKAKNIRGAAQVIVEQFDGNVPQTMDQLLKLPGVARKTANCVLGNCFGKNEGVVVDTHVKRLAFRMGFTKHADPVKVERDLMTLIPRKNWTMLSHLLIYHGRQVCMARGPKCDECPLADLCPKNGV